MNTENRISQEREPAPDVMDSLLREHARLEGGEDEPLVKTVLARTVESPQIPPEALNRPSFGWRNWVKVAAVVTLFLGGIGMLLNQIPFQESREETAFQLTITIVRPDAEDSGPVPRPDPPRKEAGQVTLVEAEPVAPGSDFIPKIEKLNPLTGERTEYFVVSANETRRGDDSLEYSGLVVVNHPEFVVRADKLIVEAAGSESDQQVGAFRALDAEIERTMGDGRIEVARGRELVYEPANRLLVLSGDHMELTMGDRTVIFNEADGKLVLRPDGYQVIRGAPARLPGAN